MSNTDSEMRALKARLAGLCYLLVVPIPWYRDEGGRILLDRLWARDLLRHLDYLSDLTVLAPMGQLPKDGLDNAECWQKPPPGLRFSPLPSANSAFRALLQFPRLVATGVASVRRADIVHSGAVGWPVPPGLVVNPAAALSGRKLVIVIESTFWRGDGRPRSLSGRLLGMVSEKLAHYSCRQASLCVFTHDSYARDFGRNTRGRVLVTPASWIDEADILSRAEAQSAWQSKPSTTRFLLAARLTEGKGIGVMLDTMQEAETRGLPIKLDVIGEGPMYDAVTALAGRLQTARLRLIDPVPYGPEFMSLLRRYHAVVVPSLTEEQPRILYDAFSQAVPALASDTPGHREAVLPETTGMRFAANDTAGLLAAMAAARPEQLARLGMSARDWVGGRTHRAMHLVRARALAEAFGAERGGA